MDPHAGCYDCEIRYAFLNVKFACSKLFCFFFNKFKFSLIEIDSIHSGFSTLRVENTRVWIKSSFPVVRIGVWSDKRGTRNCGKYQHVSRYVLTYQEDHLPRETRHDTVKKENSRGRNKQMPAFPRTFTFHQMNRNIDIRRATGLTRNRLRFNFFPTDFFHSIRAPKIPTVSFKTGEKKKKKTERNVHLGRKNSMDELQIAQLYLPTQRRLDIIPDTIFSCNRTKIAKPHNDNRVVVSHRVHAYRYTRTD